MSHDMNTLLPEIAKQHAEWPRLRGFPAAVAQKYDVPIATARRWIFEARRRGLIGYKESPCTHCGGTGIVSERRAR